MITPNRSDRKWTERPSARETETGDTESMFRLLFERSADAIWLLDPVQGVFVDCNDAAVELMRAGTKEQLLQASPSDFSPPSQPDGRSSSEQAKELMVLTAAAGSHRFEWMIRRLDGADLPVEVLSTSISTQGRQLQVVVARDISQRKQAEHALSDSQQLLESVVENISDGIYRTSREHELLFANRAYLRMSGYDSFPEMRRVPRVRLYAHPADRARLLRLLEEQGGFRGEEIEYVRRDGHRWWGSSNCVSVRDPESGAVLYHVGSVTDVTERKEAREALLRLNATLERRISERTAELSASEARLRTLVEHAPEAIVVFDGATGRFLSGNAPAGRLYGYPVEALTRLSPPDVSPEFQADGRRSADVAREKMDEAIAGGSPVFEWIHRHSSGRLVPTEVRLVRLPAEGRPLLRASIIDNTERKRHEQIQHATFQITEAVHTAEDLDSLYCQIHGIVKSLMPAENFYIALLDSNQTTFSFAYFVDERDSRPSPLRLSQGLTGYVLRTGQPLVATRRNILRRDAGGAAVVDGTNQDAAYQEVGAPAAVWLGVPLTSPGRRIIGVMALQHYEDEEAYGEAEKRILMFVAGQVATATERKRAGQALHESEQKYRALFEASSQGVMLHDPQQYLEVNPAAARILGYGSTAELVGKSPRDTSPPTQPNGEASDVLAQKHIADCLAHGSTRFDWVARHTSGRDIPLEVTLTRIEWGGRNIIQAFINDISGRKQVEEELLKSLARERELGQLKSSFVSMVSHEFRTPLGVILSSAEILEAYFDQLESAERREQLQSIQKNTRRMASLMEEVLVLGMVEAGKLECQPSPLELPAFCRRLVDELHSATGGKCPITWWVAEEAVAALADERLLQHIFTNLLSNAVNYSEKGSPVGFEIERQGAEAVCCVRDHGLGIPETDVVRIFEAFQRGSNTGDLPGTGLGLAIVKRCTELHRGSLQVQSAVGRGTTITVRLPLFPTLPQA